MQHSVWTSHYIFGWATPEMKLEHVVSCPGLELAFFYCCTQHWAVGALGLHQTLKKNLNNIFKTGCPHYSVRQAWPKAYHTVISLNPELWTGWYVLWKTGGDGWPAPSYGNFRRDQGRGKMAQQTQKTGLRSKLLLTSEKNMGAKLDCPATENMYADTRAAPVLSLGWFQ